ncbi:hypothetical protein OG21DRAFT_1511582 [Imleria badia]|nr:hypothetical protein OG21DRAFT_1511582 [Imleria badia]
MQTLLSALETARNEADTLKADYDRRLTCFQQDNFKLRSGLDARKEATVTADQTVSNLELALKAARRGAESLKANHETKVARLRQDNSDLQSALYTQKKAVIRANRKVSNFESALKTAKEATEGLKKEAVVEANQTVLSLESDLETAREDAERLEDDYNAKVTRFQQNNSELQSAFNAQNDAVVKANQTIWSLASALVTTREDAERLKRDSDAGFNTSQTISNLQSALKTARENVERLEADYNQAISNLETALKTMREDAAKLKKDSGINTNQTVSDLQLALKIAREDVERFKAAYNTKVARFQQNNSDLQSALDAQKEAVFKANRTILSLESALIAAREDGERLKASYNTKVTRFQRDNSYLRSALDAQNDAVIKADQTISSLESVLVTLREDAERRKRDEGIDTNQTIPNFRSALKTAREDVERLKADYNTKVTRFQQNNFDLQSALDAQREAVFTANRTILNLESALTAARQDGEILKANYNTTVTRFQHDNSDLQSALDAQKDAVIKANQTISSLESALVTAREDAERLERDAGIDTNQTITNLRSALKTSREDVERLEADYNTKVTRFQHDNSDLQFALDAQKDAVIKANQTISSLESALVTAREDAEGVKRDAGVNTNQTISNLQSTLKTARGDIERLNTKYDSKVAQYLRDNAALRFALNAEKRTVGEANQTISNLQSALQTSREEVGRLKKAGC